MRGEADLVDEQYGLIARVVMAGGPQVCSQ